MQTVGGKGSSQINSLKNALDRGMWSLYKDVYTSTFTAKWVSVPLLLYPSLGLVPEYSIGKVNAQYSECRLLALHDTRSLSMEVKILCSQA